MTHQWTLLGTWRSAENRKSCINKTMQKVSATLSKGGPHSISEKEGTQVTASFASPNIHP